MVITVYLIKECRCGEMFPWSSSNCLLFIKLTSLEHQRRCAESEKVLTGKHAHLKYFMLIRSDQLGTEVSEMFGNDFC